jgi:hypothetical protein
MIVVGPQHDIGLLHLTGGTAGENADDIVAGPLLPIDLDV